MQDERTSRMVPLFLVLATGIAILFSVARKPTEAEHQQVRDPYAFVADFPEPELSARAYYVKVIGEKRILLRREEKKPLAPASLSKLLTAVLVEEILSPNAMIVLSHTAKSTGEKMSMAQAGESFTKERMLQLLLISSANDAAAALAEELGGQEAFRRLAGKKIRALGLENTSFLNPAGLDEEGHYTSAEDLARMAEYIWHAHPGIWETTRISETVVRSNQGKDYLVENTNLLLKEFPAIRGGKTGFTENAKGSMVLIYPFRTPSNEMKNAAAVILGSDNRFEDGRKIIEWLEKFNN